MRQIACVDVYIDADHLTLCSHENDDRMAVRGGFQVFEFAAPFAIAAAALARQLYDVSRL